MKKGLLLVGLVLSLLGCGDVKSEAPKVERAPNAAVVSGAGVVRGGPITMVVHVGQPFAHKASQAEGVSLEPLGPVNQ